MAQYDLIVRQGTVVDPSQGMHARKDVAVMAGRIAAIEDAIPETPGCRVLDARDRVVTPGLVDLHVHAFAGGSDFGIDADTYCLPRGVTTVLDAGTCGAIHWPIFHQAILRPAHTRMFALLNLSAIGLPAAGELRDIQWADAKRAADTVQAHRDTLVGLKVRLSPSAAGSNAREALTRALEAADRARVPLMIHPTHSQELPMGEILDRMRPGDIFTHCFSRAAIDALDGVRPAARAARARGVRFDVAHGSGNFCFAAAEKALDQGFLPDTISSDLHAFNILGPVHDLPTVMAKFLLLGLSLDQVVALATWHPGRLLRDDGLLGTLRVGAPADVAVFHLRQGSFEFKDTGGECRNGRVRLEPVAVVREGTVLGASSVQGATA